MSIEVIVNPEILVWARKNIGYSLQSASEKIGFKNSKLKSATQKFEEMESGVANPTHTQLKKIAKVYHQPPIIFHLDDPPKPSKELQSFREVLIGNTSAKNVEFEALLRNCHVRQKILRSILKSTVEIIANDHVGSLKLDCDVNVAVDRMKSILGFPSEFKVGKTKNKPDKLFKFLRRKIEQTGVFVLLVGDLGSHHTKISESVFRGFAIADKFAPLIVINPNDALTEQSFALIHEFVRILLGESGIVANSCTESSNPSKSKFERFIDKVAGEFFLSSEYLETLNVSNGLDEISKHVKDVAATNMVSESMVAVRFFQLGLIDREVYKNLQEGYHKRGAERKMKYPKTAGKPKSGPNFYCELKNRIGNSTLSLIKRELKSESITHTTAARVLGINPAKIEGLYQTNV